MTPLKPSEKRLLTFFGIAAFLLLNLLGFSWFTKKKLALERERVKLEATARDMEFWKSKSGEADQKRAFLYENLTAYQDETAREIYLDNFIRKETDSLELDLKKNQILAPKLEELFHKSRYSAEVTGTWDQVLEFIYRLQMPKEFRFVSRIALKSQKKEASSDQAADVVCTFEIEKWWSPDSNNVPTAETSTANTPAPESEQSAAPVVPDKNATAATP